MNYKFEKYSYADVGSSVSVTIDSNPKVIGIDSTGGSVSVTIANPYRAGVTAIIKDIGGTNTETNLIYIFDPSQLIAYLIAPYSSVSLFYNGAGWVLV